MRESPGPVRTEANPPERGRCGFTLTELMVVVGLISVLISLLLPVMAKVRLSANSAKCASNLHQMGVAFTMYLGQSNGYLPADMWHTPATPDVAWRGYWPGIIEEHGVSGACLLCPSAAEPTGIATTRGYGDVWHCWTGQYASNGSVLRFSDVLWRDGSYGYNRYLIWSSVPGTINTISAAREFSNTPAFLDCVYAETQPFSGNTLIPATPPPDLTGAQVGPGSPEHWKFLITRHGRGINVCMADGSVTWVPLEETYMLSWNVDWVKRPLTLPPN